MPPTEITIYGRATGVASAEKLLGSLVDDAKSAGGKVALTCITKLTNGSAENDTATYECSVVAVINEPTVA